MKWHQAVKCVKNAGMKKQTWQKEPGGNTLTDYKEYMKTLEEQIQNKRARALVSEEINGHIEEQAQGYEEEGMSREDAKREAVRQMGDPVETGCALNRIHRPAFPWNFLCWRFF